MVVLVVEVSAASAHLALVVLQHQRHLNVVAECTLTTSPTPTVNGVAQIGIASQSTSRNILEV